MSQVALLRKGPVAAICHRHCALCIIPPQYVVVHDNLMAAVGKILGDAVTPEIAAAWSEAVLFLAKACIDTEESLYKMAEQRSGGWSGLETFEVVEVKELAKDIKSFSFKAPRGSPIFGQAFEFTEGQYLSLKVDPEVDGLTAPRHYTVTSPPGADFLQCTVKKVPGGKVSTYLHEKVAVGDKVQLPLPAARAPPRPPASPRQPWTPARAFVRCLSPPISPLFRDLRRIDVLDAWAPGYLDPLCRSGLSALGRFWAAPGAERRPPGAENFRKDGRLDLSQNSACT